MGVILLLMFFLMIQAQAQTVGSFSVGTTPLLEVADLAPSWSGTPSTVGSPGVFRHNVPGVYNFFGFPDVVFMAYETQIEGATAGCPSGRWGVGVAASTNGTTWTDLGPAVEPGSDYYTCVAAHPTVVPLTATSWLLYFKAEQDPATCLPSAPWGCDRYAGLGRVVISHVGFGFTAANYYQYSISAPDTQPVLQDVAQDMGYPSLVFAAGQYRMAFAQNPDLYTTSSSFTTAFPTPVSAAITANSSAVGWDRDELYSPSIVCEAGQPYTIFTGGRIWDPYPLLADASVGRYQSTNFATWSETAGPYFRTSLGDPEMRHIDVQTSDNRSQYGIFFASPSGSGNAIYLARTAGFDVGLDSKRCP